MLETCTRILAIAPYDDMHTTLKRVAQSYSNAQIDIFTGDLEEGVAIVEQIPENKYDCIISRGGTAELIKNITNLPVIEIEISVYDVLSTIKLAENYSNLYAIVGFPSITEPAHILCDLLGYQIDIFTVHSTNEATIILENLKRNNYRMVVCDMITHTIARHMELDAFLITSGLESLQMAIDQAIRISMWFQKIKQENMFLRSITQDQNGRIVTLNHNGEVFYSSPTEPSAELLEALRLHIKEIPNNSSMKFYYTDRNQLYNITAQTLLMDANKYFLFYCIPSRIPLHSNQVGIRYRNKGECEYLFINSFYNISGAMGTMDSEIRKVASIKQPIMIQGEQGTGKGQIACFLYLHSPLVNKPFVIINCERMNDKSWNFLLEHYNSPLNAMDHTIYFQNFESIPEVRGYELLSAICDTGLARRVKLIFSCNCYENKPQLNIIQQFISKLGCLTLQLPTLRSRSDEISSLASLYLSNIKTEFGYHISGFEPRAIEMLRQYHWPQNYTQFKHLLESLAALTTSTYIRSSLVAELLDKERTLHNKETFTHHHAPINCTLDDIITNTIQQAIVANNGNRAAAARQLGISRTTLWRYLNRMEPIK